MTLPTSTPKEILCAGSVILEPVLSPHGFRFEICDAGKGAGGFFAWGEFVHCDRRLELHYRFSLGLVTYHAAGKKVSHKAYMRELGRWGNHRYPGFSSGYLDDFHDLVHDLRYSEDFLTGDARILVQAAENEATCDAQKSRHLMMHYVGDTRRLEELRSLFQEKRYSEVVALVDKIQYPELMSESQRRMIEIARKRVSR
jgi:hypothetical protein